MPHYKLYLMDPINGHIESVEEIVAGDDVGAICLAQNREVNQPLELWHDGRKVRRFEPRPEIFGTK